MSQRIRIGDLLVQNNVITAAQLDQAINQQKSDGGKLGKVLVDLGFVQEERLLNLLAKQLQIPFIDIKNYDFDYELITKLPETYARRFRAIVLKDTSDALLVGMVDPLDIYAYDEVSHYLKRQVNLAIVRESDLLRSIDVVYRHNEQITGFAEQLSDELSASQLDITHIGEGAAEEDAPVVKLLETLFEDAINIKASDIHIEPDEHVLRIRQRVDGVLHEQIMQEKNIAPALTQRLKIMGGLNIAERRMPQDGRFHISIDKHNIDVRLSTMPVQYGESVVMRILDQTAGSLSLNQLGMPESILTEVNKLIKAPHGMILVTGPTGSGKTTTLYSMLNALNQPNKKIITVEDPVEYRLPRINQVQVNPTIDLSFSRVLRSALRQDPDVLMVGEIRDRETASIALRAAMTGHLVLATLHTNDAISSAMRLIDIGAEGFLVAAAIRAIIAQRLIRRICVNCTTTYEPDIQELAWLQNALGERAQQIQFKIGKGCSQCNQSGYHSRIGVYELLEPDVDMLQALRKNDQAGFVKAAMNSKVKPLSVSALDLAIQGITSINEVMRIAGEIDEAHEQIDVPNQQVS